jgi:transcription antitermination factor NusG
MRIMNPRTELERVDALEHILLRRMMAAGLTAVEAELQYHGITHYLPVELVEIKHHRTKKTITLRRPLVPGYVFVEDVTDWPLFERLRWAAGPVRIAQEPAPIPEKDMASIRKAEADIELVNAQRRSAQDLTSRKLKNRFPHGSKVTIIGQHMLSGRQAFVVEATGRKTIKAVIDNLNSLQVEVPIENVTISE